MAHVGLALMLEQFGPARALDLARAAETAGLSGLLAADVFQPWIPAPNGSDDADRAPFMWNVLSAAAAHTSGPLGAVLTPNYRWHPAMIAQASATLAAMYPGRHWLGLSAGEALNDAITGAHWPRPPERIDAMFEAADHIRKLLTNSAAGRDTRISGTHARLEGARLWTLPPAPPKILIATAGPLTARRAGRHADGFITMGGSLEKAATLMERFTQGAREAGKDPGATLKVVRLHVSFAPSIEQATTAALRHWPQAAMRFNTSDLRSPFDVAQIAKLVRPEDFAGNLLITSDAGEIADLVRGYRGLGFDEVYLHNVGSNDEDWFAAVRAGILPALR